MGTSLIRTYDTQVKLKEIAFEDVNINPKVSIIVPAYNNEIYLEKCLFSLVEQTLKKCLETLLKDRNDYKAALSKGIIEELVDFNEMVSVKIIDYIKKWSGGNG